MMQKLYAAQSTEPLDVICGRIANTLHLPQFRNLAGNEYFCSAISDAAAYALEFKEFLQDVDEKAAARLGPLYFWDLAWRANIGFQFNYQITFRWTPEGLSRSQARRIRQVLRETPDGIQFHGENRQAQPSPAPSDSQP